ncbi:MAG TPA: hypothetical protein VE153_25175 [Myxococcus sp.]|nr:hypothetical protein [Myxococcus sp.]
MSPSHALLAGAAGTVVLRAVVALRNRVLGRAPPYAARHIAARLAHRFLHRELTPLQARRWGAAMRAVYGPLLGVAWAPVRESTPPGLVSSGLLLGAGVLALELTAFPLLRATAPPRTWSPAESVWLAAQVAVFGLVTEATLRALPR